MATKGGPLADLKVLDLSEGVAEKGNQILSGPHFNAQNFWEVVEHPDAGTHPYLSRPFKHSKTPGSTRMHAPLLG